MTENYLLPCDDTPVIRGIKISVERAMDVVTTGEMEMEAIVVDMDEFWDQEERVGDFASCGCSCKYWPEKICTKGCSPPHKTHICVTSAESSVRRSLTST